MPYNILKSLFRSVMIVCMYIALLALNFFHISSAHNSQDTPQDNGTTNCSFWHVPVIRNNSTTCECGPTLSGVVSCTPEATVSDCFCMSYLDEDGETNIIGNCPYTCIVGGSSNVSCPAKLHREGQLCGRCEDGFAFPVYSYSMGCVPCTNSTSYNWLKYIAVAYIPLTVFYFAVIIFRIRATSAEMSALLFLTQQSTFSTIMKIEYTIIPPHILVHIVLAFMGIVNLDFFKGVYEPLCFNMSSLQVTALDYLIGIYPLFMILVTYVLVKLHDNFSFAVQLWKPFNKCFAKMDREWNMKGSLVEAFATFLILSYMKMLNVSIDLLTPVSLFDISGNPRSKTFVYIDGTVEYFGSDHLPYGILAIVVLLVFTILPVFLLCLYPCYCCQRCLVRSKLSCQSLHIFMDSFQGCYREEPRYCKCFAAVYLLARIGSIVSFSFTLTTENYWVTQQFFIVLPVVILAIVQPYKNTKFHYIDTILLLSMIGERSFRLQKISPHLTLSYVLHQIMLQTNLLVPVVYTAGLLVYKITPTCVMDKVSSSVQNCRRRNDECDSDPWPDRLDKKNGEQTPLLA